MTLKPLYILAVTAAVALAGCSGGDKTAPEAASTAPKAAPAESSSAAENPKPAVVADLGEKVFKKCRTCHTLKDGEKHRVGPNLYGIIGAAAAQKDGFNYSKAMKASGVTWTDENLDGYLTRPNKFMPGNQMTFIGLKKPEDRAAVIAYLKTETAP